MRERNRFKETPEYEHKVYVVKHYRTSKANVFWFSNKDKQIIFQDYTEILVRGKHVTYVNKIG